MPKTPDDVKKGMECCTNDECREKCVNCPYIDGTCENDLYAVEKDALALIRQKEQENAEQAERIRVLENRNNALYHTILGVMHFVDKWHDCPAYDPDKDLQGTAAVERAAHAREIALQAIEKLEASVPRWISVEDEPPKNVYLQVYVAKFGCVEKAKHEGLLWRTSGGESLNIDWVTHWMPLPEPPKEAAT